MCGSHREFLLKYCFIFPLRVSFKGEIGVDYGGVKREFFTIAIKEILAETNLLGTCPNGNMVWFTDQPLKATPIQRQNSSASTSSAPAAGNDREDMVTETSPRHPPRKLARLDSVDGTVDANSTAATAVAHVTSALPLPTTEPTSSPRSTKYDRFVLTRPLAYYLGLLVGLAAYNEVHVDVPLPPCVYKIIKGEEVSVLITRLPGIRHTLHRVVITNALFYCSFLCTCTNIVLQLILTDLWAVDSSLAAGLQALLSFEEGAGSIEDMFGVNFTASANPLLGSGDSVSLAILMFFTPYYP